MAEVVSIPFLFALGEYVHWANGAEPWAHAWQVLQRRMTQSLVSAWTEYLLISVTDPGHAPVWTFEADLLPWNGGSRP